MYGLEGMELARDVYKEMLEWKKARDKAALHGSPRVTVLKLEGPRRTGKTFLAEKFAEENYNLKFHTITYLQTFKLINVK
jgi:SpoVK/Ycf46/Vps4 family AAA+-type ATPase